MEKSRGFSTENDAELEHMLELSSSCMQIVKWEALSLGEGRRAMSDNVLLRCVCDRGYFRGGAKDGRVLVQYVALSLSCNNLINGTDWERIGQNPVEGETSTPVEKTAFARINEQVKMFEKVDAENWHLHGWNQKYPANLSLEADVQ